MMDVDTLVRTINSTGHYAKNTARGIVVDGTQLVTLQPYVEEPTPETMKTTSTALHGIVKELTPITTVSVNATPDSQPGSSTYGPYWRLDFNEAMALEIDGVSYDLSPASYDEKTCALHFELFGQQIVCESGASWGQIVVAIRRARDGV